MSHHEKGKEKKKKKGRAYVTQVPNTLDRLQVIQQDHESGLHRRLHLCKLDNLGSVHGNSLSAYRTHINGSFMQWIIFFNGPTKLMFSWTIQNDYGGLMANILKLSY